MTRLLIFDSFLLASTSVALAQDQDDPARRAVGVNYNYREMTGYEFGLSLGQIEWATQPSDFSLTSGLTGVKSDLLLAA